MPYGISASRAVERSRNPRPRRIQPGDGTDTTVAGDDENIVHSGGQPRGRSFESRISEAGMRAPFIEDPRVKTPGQQMADAIYGPEKKKSELSGIDWLKAHAPSERKKRESEEMQRRSRAALGPDATERREKSRADRRFRERGNRVEGGKLKGDLDQKQRRIAYQGDTVVGYSGKKPRIEGPGAANVLSRPAEAAGPPAEAPAEAAGFKRPSERKPLWDSDIGPRDEHNRSSNELGRNLRSMSRIPQSLRG